MVSSGDQATTAASSGLARGRANSGGGGGGNRAAERRPCRSCVRPGCTSPRLLLPERLTVRLPACCGLRRRSGSGRSQQQEVLSSLGESAAQAAGLLDVQGCEIAALEIARPPCAAQVSRSREGRPGPGQTWACCRTACTLPRSLPIRAPHVQATMLRATARLVPSLLPRAEAALGTRSMGLGGLKGECRGARGGRGGRAESRAASPAHRCRLRHPSQATMTARRPRR